MQIVGWCHDCGCRIYDDEKYFEIFDYLFCDQCTVERWKKIIEEG